MIRFISVCISAAALALAAAPAPADVSREVTERVIAGAGLHGLRVVNPSGRVAILPSHDGRLHLKALKILHGTAAERARLSTETRVETGEEQGVYVVRVSYRQRTAMHVNLWDLFSGLEFPRAEVELTLEAPGSMPIQVSSSSGDVETTDLPGPQQIITSSGDVDVRGARSAVQVTSSSGDVTADGLAAAGIRTTSGDLVLENVRGPLAARTSSGDVTVRGAEDSLSIATVSGDVRIEQAPRGLSVSTSSGAVTARGAGGKVTVESSSGDVEMDLRTPLSLARIVTSSGDVGVRLGHGVGGVLEVRTSRGTLDVSAPAQIRQVNRRSLSAVIGRGGAPVTLRTTSGNIHVASGGD